ncbi:MAG: cupin domain-containing protein [Gammaproteobacteria bacterium]|nr:cupin domain-containing protein [Gammaproteobacteria bacterium]
MVSAHGSHGDDEVVPQSEYTTAKELGLEGPGETRGVASVEKLGGLDLAEEFPAMKGRQFRARRITIEPGGVIAVHRHQQRPGFAYILEGELIEHRNDHPEPLVRRAGDVAMEKTGVAHWWENKSGTVVKALVVDIIPGQSE